MFIQVTLIAVGEVNKKLRIVNVDHVVRFDPYDIEGQMPVARISMRDGSHFLTQESFVKVQHMLGFPELPEEGALEVYTIDEDLYTAIRGDNGVMMWENEKSQKRVSVLRLIGISVYADRYCVGTEIYFNVILKSPSHD